MTDSVEHFRDTSIAASRNGSAPIKRLECIDRPQDGGEIIWKKI
jgi:hypothetical protein